MKQKRLSLSKLLDIKSDIDVVDIGANPIDGDPPYKVLMDDGLVRLVGFEPNPDALARLNNKKGDREIYLPDAVFDGQDHELKICQAEGMTSLLEPNAELLGYFHGFGNWGKVLERRIIRTVRLDDVSSIKNMDYLKIDIQGGELEVFRNGRTRLRDCLVIQTEVEFVEVYKEQPLFSEVEQFLRMQGFIFHRFSPISMRTIQPMLFNNDILANHSQAMHADAVFIRDFTKFDKLSPLKLKKLSIILHDVYEAYDLVLRALMEYDKKMTSNLAEQYLSLING